MMIHPSYSELMEVINKDKDPDEVPVVSSRYSVVLATSKRARQLIDGEEPLVRAANDIKPLSVAVQEVYEGKVKILPAETANVAAE